MSGDAVPEGYKQLAGVSPAEDDIGPFYYRREGDSLRLGFRVAAKNCNGIGTAHGGVLMTFADYASTIAYELLCSVTNRVRFEYQD